MKKSKFTEAQIVFAPKQAEQGVAISKNSSLTKLNLRYNNIGDEGAKALGLLPKNWSTSAG